VVRQWTVTPLFAGSIPVVRPIFICYFFWFFCSKVIIITLFNLFIFIDSFNIHSKFCEAKPIKFYEEGFAKQNLG